MSALKEIHPIYEVLVVDDEPGQRDSLKQLMTLSGYEVSTASCGFDAIEMLEQRVYDSVLLDLNMPNGSGYDVIDHVANSNIDVKIIVISGNTDFESTRNALKKGAYDFLKKPYMPDELLATVKNASSTKQLEVANGHIQRKLEESEHLHRFIVDNSPDIVFMLDTDGNFTFLNETVYKALGFKKQELLGQHYSKLVSSPNKEMAKYVFAEPRDGQSTSHNVELKLTCKGGSEHRYFDTASMSIDPGGAGISHGIYGVARDVTEKKQERRCVTAAKKKNV